MIESDTDFENRAYQGEALQGSWRRKVITRPTLPPPQLTHKEMIIDLLFLLQLQVWIKETGQILELGTEPFETFPQIAERLIIWELELTFLETATSGSHTTFVG